MSEKNRLARVQWAKKHKYPKKAWNKTVYTDERSIWLSRGRIKMWTKSDTKRTAPTTKHTPKINVWAGFSSMGTFPLSIFADNMNSQMFITILEGHLLTQAEVFHQNGWRLVMDNDPNTLRRLSRNFCPKISQTIYHGLRRALTSTRLRMFSDGLNENTKLAPRTISELREKLEIVWSNINPEFLKPYCDSMPRRCQLVIESGGFPINY